MKTFVYYESLSQGAKKAFDRGDGNYRKYIIDGKYIAVKDENGKPIHFTLVIKNNNPIIKEKTK